MCQQVQKFEDRDTSVRIIRYFYIFILSYLILPDRSFPFTRYNQVPHSPPPLRPYSNTPEEAGEEALTKKKIIRPEHPDIISSNSHS